jgi:UDP-glucose-4-epimerase GalE
MRVLVTGGAGYVGSHAAKALARAGFEPVVFDNLSCGHARSVRWGPFVQGDLADRELLQKSLTGNGIEAVCHFAANAYVGESIDQPRKYFQNNIVNTLNLLDAMLDAGVRKLIFSSSCAVYGEPQQIPIPEDHRRQPISPYGESKRFVEKALRWYSDAYSLQFMSLRYFNASGADPEGELGEVHDPETHAVPLAIQTALGQRPHFEIFGTDYPTSDGTAVRDYVHVTDIAEAHVKALQRLSDQGQSMALNLGTGAGHSVLEVIAAVERAGGRPVNVLKSARRSGDPAVLVADGARAKQILDWQPRYSSLDSIVESAWRWHTGPEQLSERARD